jgi:hypothetical protein
VRRANSRGLARKAREAQGHLGWIEAHAALIAERANCDVDDAQGSSFLGSRGGGDLTQPERYAARRLAVTDPVEAAMVELVTELLAAQRAAARARQAGSRIIPE